MKIPPQFVQELKNSLNIIDVASNYMKLVKKGKNYFAACPFHTEKTPSFSLNDQLQIFHCFGCGKSGDVISLVMEMEHMTYPETIQFLAEKANLRLPTSAPDEDEARYRDRKFLYTVMEETLRFFVRALESDEGGSARDYLQGRGISVATIDRFKLGLAPDGGFHLVSYLHKLGITDDTMLAAGVAKRSEKSGRLYDAFRNRLIVPIRDLHGRVIAFGGRILGEGEPKYLNSPETPIYQKGYHLFGLDQSLKEIRALDHAVLVEGYFDMIVPAQAGVPNVVASLGTSLTPAQVKLLGRFTRNVTVCFDPDAAGLNAALRSVEIFLEHDFECRVALLPPGDDPDTLVQKGGASAFQAVMEQALPFLDFVFQRAVAASGGAASVKQKVKVMEGMFPFVIKIPSPVERSRYLSELAKRLDLDENTLFRQYNFFSKTRKLDADQFSQAAPPEILLSEEKLLAFLHHFPESAPRVLTGTNVTFEGLKTSNILAKMKEMVDADGLLNLEQLETDLSEDERVILHHVLYRWATQVTEKEAVDCVQTLRLKSLKKKRQQVQEQLQVLDREGKLAECRSLYETKRLIEEEIKAIG